MQRSGSRSKFAAQATRSSAAAECRRASLQHLEIGDRRVRTLLYEAANVMPTRYKGSLKLKDWAFAIAKRSTMRKARIALARRLAIIMHAMLRHGTEFKPD